MIELITAFLAAAWALVVPGAPALAFVKRFGGPTTLGLAVVPLFSVVFNVLVLLLVNMAGIRPDLRWYGILMTFATVVLLLLARQSLPTWRGAVRASAPALATLIAALSLWLWAYRGFLLQAANADGSFHNLWLRRIGDSGSVLWADFWIASPLSPIGEGPTSIAGIAGTASYAQAWHASVAVGASVFGANYAVTGLVSVILFWGFALTLGLSALARLWVARDRLLGGIAGLIAQFMPLVPGVPMTWGAIPSVVGVSMLPAAFSAWIWAFRTRRSLALVTVPTVFGALLVVHPPEAATLLVVGGLMVGVDAAQRRQWWKLSVPVVAFGIFALGYVAVSRLRPDLFLSLSEQKGRYLFEQAVGKFVTGSVQTCTNALDQTTCDRDLFVGVAFLLGVGLSMVLRERLFVLAGLGLMSIIYMASAAPEPFFPALRVYTFPWYASYERTAWVAVPLLAMFIAYGVTVLIRCFRGGSQTGRVLGFAGLAVLAVFVLRGVEPTVAQLRAGPAENQIARPGAETVFKAAKGLAGSNGMIASPPASGGVYGYVYEGLRVSNGFVGIDGRGDHEIYRLITEPSLICSDDLVRAAVERNRIRGLLFADRGIAWAGQVADPASFERIPGWDLQASGGGVYLLREDPVSCDTS